MGSGMRSEWNGKWNNSPIGHSPDNEAQGMY